MALLAPPPPQPWQDLVTVYLHYVGCVMWRVMALRTALQLRLNKPKHSHLCQFFIIMLVLHFWIPVKSEEAASFKSDKHKLITAFTNQSIQKWKPLNTDTSKGINGDLAGVLNYRTEIVGLNIKVKHLKIAKSTRLCIELLLLTCKFKNLAIILQGLHISTAVRVYKSQVEERVFCLSFTLCVHVVLLIWTVMVAILCINIIIFIFITLEKNAYETKQ